MYRALLISTLCTGLIAGPASAELRDVRARADGLNGQVWLAFDEQPQSAELSQAAGRVSLMIGGVEVRRREVSPYRADLVSRVSITPVADGALVELGQAAAWQEVRAELRQGGVLVSFSLDAPVAATSPAAAPSHAPATGNAAASVMPADHGTDAGNRHGQPASGGDSHAAPGGAAAAADTADDHASVDEQVPAADDTQAPQNHAPAPLAPAAPANPVAAAASNATGECAETGATVAENPWDDESLHRHAACLTRTGDLQPAAIIYEQMLAFAPDDFRALIALAEVRAEQGETAEARELYSQAASYAISDAEAARARARLRELQQR